MKTLKSLVAVAMLVVTGCAQNPFALFKTTGTVNTSQVPTLVAQTPLGHVGQDLADAAKVAFDAYAQAKSGNVDYVWGLMQALNAYSTVIKDSADVKALIAAWDGTSDQTLANRIASLFGASSGTTQQRLATLAAAAQQTAQSKAP